MRRPIRGTRPWRGFQHRSASDRHSVVHGSRGRLDCATVRTLRRTWTRSPNPPTPFPPPPAAGPRRRPPRRRQCSTHHRPPLHAIAPAHRFPGPPSAAPNQLLAYTTSPAGRYSPALPRAARRPYHDVMHASPDIVPVSRFREDVAGVISRATADGKPLFITQGGRLTAVLLSRRRYDQLFELLADMEGDPDRESRSRRLPSRTDWPVHGFHPTHPRTHFDTLFGLVDPATAAFFADQGIWTEIRAALHLPIPGSTAMSRPIPSPTGVPLIRTKTTSSNHQGRPASAQSCARLTALRPFFSRPFRIAGRAASLFHWVWKTLIAPGAPRRQGGGGHPARREARPVARVAVPHDDVAIAGVTGRLDRGRGLRPVRRPEERLGDRLAGHEDDDAPPAQAPAALLAPGLVVGRGRRAHARSRRSPATS